MRKILKNEKYFPIKSANPPRFIRCFANFIKLWEIACRANLTLTFSIPRKENLVNAKFCFKLPKKLSISIFLFEYMFLVSSFSKSKYLCFAFNSSYVGLYSIVLFPFAFVHRCFIGQSLQSSHLYFLKSLLYPYLSVLLIYFSKSTYLLFAHMKLSLNTSYFQFDEFFMSFCICSSVLFSSYYMVLVLDNYFLHSKYSFLHFRILHQLLLFLVLLFLVL